MVIYCIQKIMSGYLKYRIKKYYCNSEYENIIALLDKAIEIDYNNKCLQMQKIIILGLIGRYNEFEKKVELIYNNKPFCKKKYAKLYLKILAVYNGIAFMNNASDKFIIAKIMEKKDEKKYLGSPYKFIGYTIDAYQRGNWEKALYYASWLYNEKGEFFRLFSSYMLMNIYKRMDVQEKFIIYEKQYLKNSKYSC